ncbi:coiled-coil domain-containing protein 146 [Microcaecilia unicolor]|uniref:Coiled-coil domain-containing protein 146 n=1 Tax=Microcaecilia unicolor TaxID=1415580 RepID=A0A6P7Z9Z9_9AMPH|nr:coiled-coil domain-containing protein 146 [Microcaecilia unicolor]
MSSVSGESPRSSDSEEEEKPLFPIAPTFNIEEEWPRNVSESPALQYLDELFSTGKLPGTKVAKLKAKYTLLHDTLKRIQDSEIQLLQDAKRFTIELEQQRRELQKADDFPAVVKTEGANLRKQLFKYQNEYAQAKEREHNMQYKLNRLQEEKEILEREYERIPNLAELEKKAKMLKDTCEDLRKESSQRKLEIKALKEDLEFKQKQVLKEQEELKIVLEEQNSLKDELVQLHNFPAQLAKDMEKINRRTVEVQKNIRKLDLNCQELSTVVKQVEFKAKKMMEEKQDITRELEGKQAFLENKEQQFNQLTKMLLLAKENEAMAFSERATVDLNLRHATIQRQAQNEALTRKQREKDRELKNVKKLELQLKTASDALSHVQMIYEKLQVEMDVLPEDDGSLLERRMVLHQEVETIKRNLAQQQTLTDVEAHMVEQCIAEEQQLIKEQTQYREDLISLTRLAQIKSDERDQKSRILVKAKRRCAVILQEIKEKDLFIVGHKKKSVRDEKRLEQFSAIYDIVRRERNKCVNLLQTANQRISEMREKTRIMGNEIEILRTNVLNKERQLQKAKLKQTNSQMIRDSLRNSISKTSVSFQEMNDRKQQQKLEIGRLTRMITSAEDDMIDLRRKYESAIQNRNERGIQLIEREEEVCIFYEKMNIQEMLIRNGDVEIQAMDEKIRFLKMQTTEKNRQIDQARKCLSDKKVLEEEIVSLQIQLARCRDKVHELELKMEDPNAENRIRQLEGNDPSQADLIKKIEELELRLAEKEEKLLEKDLLFEQVLRLSDRLQIKAENGKYDTLTLANKMSDLQRKIKDTTRKMMALIAELSMKQAKTIKLQQEVRDKEQFVETCYARLEQGLPPSEETEQEWMRLLRNQRRHQADLEEKARNADEEKQHMLPNGLYTTAEQRPNAYIPEDVAALPLPRPYGALAPFKPTEPGTSMRHIRKPAVKPIEI